MLVVVKTFWLRAQYQIGFGSNKGGAAKGKNEFAYFWRPKRKKILKEKLRYVWLLLSWLLFGAAAHGQVYDSVFYPTDSSAVLYFHNHLDVYSPLMTKYNDSSLVDFEEYDPLQQRYDFFATQGNVGMAYRPLDYAPRQHTGFDYGIYSFDAYLVDQPEVKYYLNAKPYSEIGYVTGVKKEQRLRVCHQERVF